jgi:hypothetical protein
MNASDLLKRRPLPPRADLAASAQVVDVLCMALIRGAVPLGDGITVLVCGGRRYSDRAWVFRALDWLDAEVGIGRVVEGACGLDEHPAPDGTFPGPTTGERTGADRWAHEWAVERKVATVAVPARWSTYDDGAGPERNARMLRMHEPQLVVAFPGGPGSADMCRKAGLAGTPVWRVPA